MSSPWPVVEFGLIGSLISFQEPRSEVLVVVIDEARTVHPFGEDLQPAYHPDARSADVVRVPQGYRIDLRSATGSFASMARG